MTITLREQQPMVKYRHTHFGDSRATATMSPDIAAMVHTSVYPTVVNVFFRR
jgi:hypothetical protein